MLRLLLPLLLLFAPLRAAENSSSDFLTDLALNLASTSGAAVAATGKDIVPRTGLAISQGISHLADAGRIIRETNKALARDDAFAALGTATTLLAGKTAELAASSALRILLAGANPIASGAITLLGGTLAKAATEGILEAFFAMIYEWIKESERQASNRPSSFDDALDALSNSHIDHLNHIASSPSQNQALQITSSQLTAAAQAQAAQNQAALNASIAAGLQQLGSQVAETAQTSSGKPLSNPGLTSGHIPPTLAQLEREISDLRNVIAQIDANLRRQRAAGSPAPHVIRALEQNRQTAQTELRRLESLRSRY